MQQFSHQDRGSDSPQVLQLFQSYLLLCCESDCRLAQKPAFHQLSYAAFSTDFHPMTSAWKSLTLCFLSFLDFVLPCSVVIPAADGRGALVGFLILSYNGCPIRVRPSCGQLQFTASKSSISNTRSCVLPHSTFPLPNCQTAQYISPGCC